MKYLFGVFGVVTLAVVGFALQIIFIKHACAADIYVPVQVGGASWSMAGDNWWYQDTHAHTIDRRGPAASAGIGWQATRHFALELNARYIGGGKIDAEWESDANYFNAAGGNHAVTNRGVSRWRVTGYSLDALGSLGMFYVGAGVFPFHQKWRVEHREVNVWETQECNEDRSSTGYVFRVGAVVNRATVEFQRFINLWTDNSGVKAATVLSVGYRF